MKYKPLLYLLLAVGIKAAAQDHRFQIGAGYQRTWMVDQQASPLKYQSSEKQFHSNISTQAAKENSMRSWAVRWETFHLQVFSTGSFTVPVILLMEVLL